MNDKKSEFNKVLRSIMNSILYGLTSVLIIILFISFIKYSSKFISQYTGIHGEYLTFIYIVFFLTFSISILTTRHNKITIVICP